MLLFFVCFFMSLVVWGGILAPNSEVNLSNNISFSQYGRHAFGSVNTISNSRSTPQNRAQNRAKTGFEILDDSESIFLLKKCSQSDRIGPNIPLISTIIFKASKKKVPVVNSRWALLWPLRGKGGTGLYWELSTSGIPP